MSQCDCIVHEQPGNNSSRHLLTRQISVFKLNSILVLLLLMLTLTIGKLVYVSNRLIHKQHQFKPGLETLAHVQQSNMIHY